MAIIGFLILGLVAGAIARFLVPGRDPMGWVGTIVLGCVGALVGGFLGKALFNDSDGAGLFASVVGAVIVLFIYNAVARRERTV